MSDTRRSLSALQTLLADNTTGLITAQAIRDMLVSLYGRALVETHSASASATLDFTTGITSLYSKYIVEIANILPDTSGQNFVMQVSTDGGSTWQTTNYWHASNWIGSGNVSGQSGAESESTMLLVGVVKTSAEGVSGNLRLQDFTSSAAAKSVVGQITHPASNDAHRYLWNIGAWWVSTSAVNAIRFKFASGNIVSGTIRLYGINE